MQKAGSFAGLKRALFAAGSVIVASATMGMAAAGTTRSPDPPGLAEAGFPASLMPAEVPYRETSPFRAISTLTPRLRARGYNACWVPDNGFGAYSRWQRIGMGQMIVPLRGGHTDDFGYDVVVHFHGHDAVRHAFVEAARGVVLVGIDLGNSSGPYEHAFESSAAFPALLEKVQRGLVKASGDARAHVRHLALSSWSAGYGAVKRILAQSKGGIEAVVLLDSLHSGYEPRDDGAGRSMHRVWGPPISAVADYAARAARGNVFLYMSHSEIVPPGYASTSQVADYLIDRVGGVRTPRQAMSPLGAELVSGFDRRGMHVRGYLGGDKPAHCAHVTLLAETVRDDLEPAWQTPSAAP
ncbi:MAG TPA: hypothetical protein VJT73_03115 [Polyangiaceae bacterium]|nr:hypothetical protein [Polyangiaceae bacterium]